MTFIGKFLCRTTTFKNNIDKNVSEIPLDCSQDSPAPNWIFDYS